MKWKDHISTEAQKQLQIFIFPILSPDLRCRLNEVWKLHVKRTLPSSNRKTNFSFLGADREKIQSLQCPNGYCTQHPESAEFSQLLVAHMFWSLLKALLGSRSSERGRGNPEHLAGGPAENCSKQRNLSLHINLDQNPLNSLSDWWLWLLVLQPSVQPVQVNEIGAKFVMPKPTPGGAGRALALLGAKEAVFKGINYWDYCQLTAKHWFLSMRHKLADISSSGPYSKCNKFSLCSYCCHLLFLFRLWRKGTERRASLHILPYLTPCVSLPWTDNASFPSPGKHPGSCLILFIACCKTPACTWHNCYSLFYEMKQNTLPCWKAGLVPRFCTAPWQKGPGSPKIPKASPSHHSSVCTWNAKILRYLGPWFIQHPQHKSWSFKEKPIAAEVTTHLNFFLFPCPQGKLHL